MTRQEANKKLLKELEWFIEICPDQRFGQILCNYFFPKYQTIDPFFVEPTDTLTEVDRAKKCVILDEIVPIGVLSSDVKGKVNPDQVREQIMRKMKQAANTLKIVNPDTKERNNLHTQKPCQ